MKQDDRAEREEPALPARQAFVVQLTRESEGRPGTFSGRVVHFGSGRRARFAST